VKHCWLFYWM